MYRKKGHSEVETEEQFEFSNLIDFNPMAHLLGSQACLESLEQDITDVQTTVLDLLSRVGPVQSPSWKYPDKIACELDIEELLERYSHSNDEDHCKLSHIILFELLIDR